MHEKIDILRAYYGLIGKDCVPIETDLKATPLSTDTFFSLVRMVRNSNKHFFLFLYNVKIQNDSGFLDNLNGSKSIYINQVRKEQSIMVIEFAFELKDFLQTNENLNKLKMQKEALFPHSNNNTLQDMKNINTLASIMQILRKDSYKRSLGEETRLEVASFDADFF